MVSLDGSVLQWAVPVIATVMIAVATIVLALKKKVSSKTYVGEKVVYEFNENDVATAELDYSELQRNLNEGVHALDNVRDNVQTLFSGVHGAQVLHSEVENCVSALAEEIDLSASSETAVCELEKLLENEIRSRWALTVSHDKELKAISSKCEALETALNTARENLDLNLMTQKAEFESIIRAKEDEMKILEEFRSDHMHQFLELQNQLKESNLEIETLKAESGDQKKAIADATEALETALKTARENLDLDLMTQKAAFESIIRAKEDEMKILEELRSDHMHQYLELQNQLKESNLEIKTLKAENGDQKKAIADATEAIETALKTARENLDLDLMTQKAAFESIISAKEDEMKILEELRSDHMHQFSELQNQLKESKLEIETLKAENDDQKKVIADATQSSNESAKVQAEFPRVEEAIQLKTSEFESTISLLIQNYETQIAELNEVIASQKSMDEDTEQRERAFAETLQESLAAVNKSKESEIAAIHQEYKKTLAVKEAELDAARLEFQSKLTSANKALEQQAKSFEERLKAELDAQMACSSKRLEFSELTISKLQEELQLCRTVINDLNAQVKISKFKADGAGVLLDRVHNYKTQLVFSDQEKSELLHSLESRDQDLRNLNEKLKDQELVIQEFEYFIREYEIELKNRVETLNLIDSTYSLKVAYLETCLDQHSEEQFRSQQIAMKISNEESPREQIEQLQLAVEQQQAEFAATLNAFQIASADKITSIEESFEKERAIITANRDELSSTLLANTAELERLHGVIAEKQKEIEALHQNLENGICEITQQFESQKKQLADDHEQVLQAMKLEQELQIAQFVEASEAQQLVMVEKTKTETAREWQSIIESSEAIFQEKLQAAVDAARSVNQVENESVVRNAIQHEKDLAQEQQQAALKELQLAIEHQQTEFAATLSTLQIASADKIASIKESFEKEREIITANRDELSSTLLANTAELERLHGVIAEKQKEIEALHRNLEDGICEITQQFESQKKQLADDHEQVLQALKLEQELQIAQFVEASRAQQLVMVEKAKTETAREWQAIVESSEAIFQEQLQAAVDATRSVMQVENESVVRNAIQHEKDLAQEQQRAALKELQELHELRIAEVDGAWQMKLDSQCSLVESLQSKLDQLDRFHKPKSKAVLGERDPLTGSRPGTGSNGSASKRNKQDAKENAPGEADMPGQSSDSVKTVSSRGSRSRSRRDSQGHRYWKASDFQIRSELGQGTFGIHYLAIEHQTSTRYVINKISRKKIEKSKMSDVLIQRIEMLGQLMHPYLRRMLGSFEDDRWIYIVQEYIANSKPLSNHLQDLLSKKYVFPPSDVAFLMSCLANALDYIHSKGMVHCQVAVHKVLLTANGIPKLAGPTIGITNLPVRPPECLNDGSLINNLTWAVDAWSLGVLAFTLLVGRVPFSVSDNVVDLNLVANEAPVFSSHSDPLAQSLIESLLCKDPSKRPAMNQVLVHPFILHYQKKEPLSTIREDQCLL